MTYSMVSEDRSAISVASIASKMSNTPKKISKPGSGSPKDDSSKTTLPWRKYFKSSTGPLGAASYWNHAQQPQTNTYKRGRAIFDQLSKDDVDFNKRYPSTKAQTNSKPTSGDTKRPQTAPGSQIPTAIKTGILKKHEQYPRKSDRRYEPKQHEQHPGKSERRHEPKKLVQNEPFDYWKSRTGDANGQKAIRPSTAPAQCNRVEAYQHKLTALHDHRVKNLGFTDPMFDRPQKKHFPEKTDSKVFAPPLKYFESGGNFLSWEGKELKRRKTFAIKYDQKICLF